MFAILATTFASCSTQEEDEEKITDGNFTGTFVVSPIVLGTKNEGGTLVGTVEYSLGRDGKVEKFQTAGQTSRFEKTYTNLKKGDIIKYKIDFYGSVYVYCLDGKGNVIFDKGTPLLAGSGGEIQICLY